MTRVRFIATSLVLLTTLGAALFVERARLNELWRDLNRPELPASVSYEETVEAEEEDEEEEPVMPSEPEPVPVPEEPLPVVEDFPLTYNLAVPFTSQAPYANWDETHEQACEEASLYMVNLYYQGVPEGVVDPEEAEKEILRIVDFEMTLFGYFEDTTAEQTGMLAEQMYGYEKVVVLEDPSVADLKREIAAGRPVIVPLAGQHLGNPYFTAPGPVYHMLVLRGYTQTSFIANDPGTRRGESYVYDIDTIMNALHDWNETNEKMLEGAKRALVVYPN